MYIHSINENWGICVILVFHLSIIHCNSIYNNLAGEFSLINKITVLYICKVPYWLKKFSNTLPHLSLPRRRMFIVLWGLR